MSSDAGASGYFRLLLPRIGVRALARKAGGGNLRINGRPGFGQQRARAHRGGDHKPCPGLDIVATRRLGRPAGLESEFAKINRREVWLSRLLWMLIGIQVWGAQRHIVHDR